MIENQSLRILPAGALTYVVAISILIATILSSVMLYIYYTRTEIIYLTSKTKNFSNLETGIDLSRAVGDSLAYQLIYSFDLYNLQSDSVSVVKSEWGLFDHYRVSSFNKFGRLYKHFLMGHQPSKRLKAALWLWDDGRPLSVSGNTKIEGDAYLPKAGIQSAYVGRVPYVNKELLYGTSLLSDHDFPNLSLKSVYEKSDSLRFLSDAKSEDLTNQYFSFDSATVIVNEMQSLFVDTLKGNAILYGGDKIVFDSLSYTEDIVCVASVIEFRSGFKGSGQFFAKDSIHVFPNVHLEYPTLLSLYNSSKGAIVLEERSEVFGVVIMSGDSQEDFHQRVLYQSDSSKICGYVYCDGMMETYGTIEGHVTTKRFLENDHRAYRENFLFNAQLSPSAVSDEMLVPDGWFASDSLYVLKYLK